MSSERMPRNNDSSYSKPFHYLSVVEEIETNGDANGNEAPYSWNFTAATLKARAEQGEKESFERGAREGQKGARLAYEQQLTALQASIASALEKFKSEREVYFSRIEPEVVQLALAIARKILHREAQMDPLLLTGLVHVALEKLDAGAHVRLRAHPGDVHFWNEYLSQSGSSRPAAELIGDPALKPGELALETDVGSTQISLESQLKEIEQGFFDLLEQRPRVR
jgi:flagellar assembly protein FliH